MKKLRNVEVHTQGQLIIVERGWSDKEVADYLKVHKVIVPKRAKGTK